MAVGTTNYPASLDTVVELVEAANNAADTLSAGIAAGDTSLSVTDGTEFAASGIVAIENELLSYTGKAGNTLTGLTRGIEGTTAASHSAGADVRQVITAASHNVQSAAIIALETKLGTGTDIAWSKMAPLTANRIVVSDAAGDIAVSPLTHNATDVLVGNIGGLDFDTTPTAANATARLIWDDTDGTLDLTLKGGNVTVPLSQRDTARVVNKSGSNLLASNYQVVRISTAQGQRLGINLARANSEPNSTDILGLISENISNNQEGFVTTRGLVTEIDTTGSLQGETWADGDILYLSPGTSGGLTKVEPQAPNHLVIIGYVVYAHANHGKIFVAIQTSWETAELHDVKITGTPTAGSLLIRNATTGVWENATLTAGSNITITNADKSITINSTASGSGDVAGPASSTDNAITRFDGTTGKLIQNSNVTLSDTGAFSFPDGIRQTFNPNGTNAGINVGAHTSDPSSLTNADLWYNSTVNQLKTRRGGATEVVATIPANLGDEIPVLSGTTGNLSASGELFWDGSGNALQIGNVSTGSLRLANATGTDSFTLIPPSSGGAIALTLPAGVGTNGQALTSNGSGGTAWTTITAGVSSVTASSPLASSGGSTPNISLTGTVPIANGGTGATTAAGALTSLGAYPATNPNGYTSNTGTVTGVTGTSPVVSSGGTAPAISLSSGYGDTQNPYASKTANYFLAAPNGSAGVPSFRAIIAADVPTLNQNTTGTAGNVTGVVAVVNGGTGVTTSTGSGSVVLSTSPSLTTPSLGVATGTSFNSITGLSSTTPLADSGSGVIGTSTTVARADHQHPVSGVTSFSAGTTGLTPSTGTTGAVTLAGTLAIANGGTNATTAAGARSSLLPSYTGNALKVLQVNSGATDVEWASVSASPGGSNEQVQFNDGGSTFGGDAGLTYNKTTNALTIGAGSLKFTGSSSGTVTVQPAAAAGTYTLTLPTTDGDANQVLTTDGSGVTSWAENKGRTTLTANRTYYVGFDVGTCTISNASPGVVTLTNHNLATGDPVIFSSTGTLPAPLVAGAVYYVLTVLTNNTFTVSLTAGGTAINTTSAGSGTHRVRTGNDANDGLTSSRTGAFLTTQKAIDTVASIDLSSYSCTIKLARGRYIDSPEAKSFTGAGPVYIEGGTSTAADTELRPISLGLVTTTPNPTNTINLNSHGLVNGTPITLFTYGAVNMPTGLERFRFYYVINATANTFQISETVGGSVKTWSTTGTSVYVGAYCWRFDNVIGLYHFKNLQIAAPNAVPGIDIITSKVNMEACDFGGAGLSETYIWAKSASVLNIVNTFSVSAGGKQFILVSDCSLLSLRSTRGTYIGTPSFSGTFIRALRCSSILMDDYATTSGSMIGSTANIAGNCAWFSGGSTLPGSGVTNPGVVNTPDQVTGASSTVAL